MNTYGWVPLCPLFTFLSNLITNRHSYLSKFPLVRLAVVIMYYQRCSVDIIVVQINAVPHLCLHQSNNFESSLAKLLLYIFLALIQLCVLQILSKFDYINYHPCYLTSVRELG